MSTDSWAKVREDDAAERPVPDGQDPDTAPAPPLAVGVRREPETVARLHFELGTCVAAMTFATNELGRHAQDEKNPHLVRALSVLRTALSEVTS